VTGQQTLQRPVRCEITVTEHGMFGASGWTGDPSEAALLLSQISDELDRIAAEAAEMLPGADWTVSVGAGRIRLIGQGHL